MIRPSTCLCFLLACGSGLYLYQTKHAAQLLDRQIAKTAHDTEALRAQTRVLQAEWTLLNDPDRLQTLANEYLALKPMQPTQFTSLVDLDQRLPAPRPPEPDPTPPAVANAPIAGPPQPIGTPAEVPSDAAVAAVEAPAAGGQPASSVGTQPALASLATDEVMPLPPPPPPVSVATAASPARTEPRPTTTPRPIKLTSEVPVDRIPVPPESRPPASRPPEGRMAAPRQLDAKASPPRPIELHLPESHSPEMHPTGSRTADAHPIQSRPADTRLATARPVQPAPRAVASASYSPPAAYSAPAPQSFSGSLLGMAHSNLPAPMPMPMPRPTPVNAAQWTNGN
jgi:hypothetical protein